MSQKGPLSLLQWGIGRCTPIWGSETGPANRSLFDTNWRDKSAATPVCNERRCDRPGHAPATPDTSAHCAELEGQGSRKQISRPVPIAQRSQGQLPDQNPLRETSTDGLSKEARYALLCDPVRPSGRSRALLRAPVLSKGKRRARIMLTQYRSRVCICPVPKARSWQASAQGVILACVMAKAEKHG